MIRMIKLTKIAREREVYDDLELSTTPTAETSPMMVNVDQIREFYPRVNGKPGTRVVFLNGAGWPVTETFEQIEAAINGTRN